MVTIVRKVSASYGGKFPYFLSSVQGMWVLLSVKEFETKNGGLAALQQQAHRSRDNP
jgi:hypothetical protein